MTWDNRAHRQRLARWQYLGTMGRIRGAEGLMQMIATDPNLQGDALLIKLAAAAQKRIKQVRKTMALHKDDWRRE